MQNNPRDADWYRGERLKGTQPRKNRPAGNYNTKEKSSSAWEEIYWDGTGWIDENGNMFTDSDFYSINELMRL